jgi:signal transduction histidine kinase
VETQKELSHFERLAVAGHIAATLAHEIGSPLSAVSTHLQLLEEDLCSSDESKRRIELIQAQLTRITGFVEELLSRTRPPTTEKAPVLVNEVLKHLLAFLDLHLHRHGIAVETRFDPDLPAIQGNQQQIEQVFLNLLNNATDAMPGGGSIRIQTSVEQVSPGSEFVVVSVRDTGTGIPAAYQVQIFDPFFTTKSSGRGTGLGLSIVSRIVRQHEGTIQVQSEPDQGTTFWMRFPAIPRSPSEPNTGTA